VDRPYSSSTSPNLNLRHPFLGCLFGRVWPSMHEKPICLHAAGRKLWRGVGKVDGKLERYKQHVTINVKTRQGNTDMENVMVTVTVIFMDFTSLQHTYSCTQKQSHSTQWRQTMALKARARLSLCMALLMFYLHANLKWKWKIPHLHRWPSQSGICESKICGRFVSSFLSKAFVFVCKFNQYRALYWRLEAENQKNKRPQHNIVLWKKSIKGISTQPKPMGYSTFLRELRWSDMSPRPKKEI